VTDLCWQGTRGREDYCAEWKTDEGETEMDSSWIVQQPGWIGPVKRSSDDPSRLG
jgi:hypothetical protein